MPYARWFLTGARKSNTSNSQHKILFSLALYGSHSFQIFLQLLVYSIHMLVYYYTVWEVSLYEDFSKTNFKILSKQIIYTVVCSIHSIDCPIIMEVRVWMYEHMGIRRGQWNCDLKGSGHWVDKLRLEITVFKNNVLRTIIILINLIRESLVGCRLWKYLNYV